MPDIKKPIKSKKQMTLDLNAYIELDYVRAVMSRQIGQELTWNQFPYELSKVIKGGGNGVH
jgi:hypothetical protein